MSALAAAAVAGIAAPAAAQTWLPINQRQAQLDGWINQGIRQRTLNRVEADKLRAEFRGIAALEAQYRRSGGIFTPAERTDLDQRMNRLAAKIRIQRNDGPWTTINQRQANLEARIKMGISGGTLTPAEAVRLRSEFNQIAALEASYRRSNGVFTAAERADLDRRMSNLSAKIRIQRKDAQRH
jgi:hypothetical protein